MPDEKFILNNPLKAPLPGVAFCDMKNAVLGEDYTLTLSFISSEEMRALNKSTRNIDKTTDILSFPLSDEEGEIYIDLEESKHEAKKFERKCENFIGFLFIHGLVHLQGLDHSDEMEQKELTFRKRFNI